MEMVRTSTNAGISNVNSSVEAASRLSENGLKEALEWKPGTLPTLRLCGAPEMEGPIDEAALSRSRRGLDGLGAKSPAPLQSTASDFLIPRRLHLMVRFGLHRCLPYQP